MTSYYYPQRLALAVLLWLPAAAGFATGNPIAVAEKSAILRVMRNYTDLYTCIVMQTEITRADLDSVFIEGSVQLPNDYMPARNFFQTRDQYFRTAASFFGYNRFIRSCNIRLTESEEYLYARLSDGTYYIWLDKSIDYIDDRDGAQHYSFCERIHVCLVADRGYRIMGVLRVKEKPADLDGDGIADAYEQQTLTRPQPVTQPAEQLSNQPTIGVSGNRTENNSVHRIWTKAHWHYTDQGWIWIEGYWRNDTTQARSYSPPPTTTRPTYNYYRYPPVQAAQYGQVIYRPRAYFTRRPFFSIFSSRKSKP